MLVINEDNSFYYKKFENKEKIEDLSYIIQSFYNKKILLELFSLGTKVIYKNKRYIVYEHGGCYKDDNDKFYLELDLFNEEENYVIKNVSSSFVIRINK